MSDKRPSRPGKSHPMAASRQVPVQKWSMSTRSRTVLKAAVAARDQPKPVPPVPLPPPDRRMEVAQTLARGAVDALGLSSNSKKAKALSQAVTAVAYKATPKNLSMDAVASVIAKVRGPPPKVQHVVIPVGSLAEAATKVSMVNMTPKSLLMNVPKPV